MTSRHLSFVFLAALAAFGCTSSDSSDDETSGSKIIAAPKCDGVPTPMCAAGTKVVDSDGDGCPDTCDPVVCPPVMPTCGPGEKVADTNGDGCALECVSCPAILCQAGTKQVDSNGDGCEDKCEPVACPPFVPTCEPGTVIADTDGDGCDLECAACPAILCQAGTKQVDSNGDGCEDKCEPVACPPFIPTCPAGQQPADTDGDGCPLECS